MVHENSRILSLLPTGLSQIQQSFADMAPRAAKKSKLHEGCPPRWPYIFAYFVQPHDRKTRTHFFWALSSFTMSFISCNRLSSMQIKNSCCLTKRLRLLLAWVTALKNRSSFRWLPISRLCDLNLSSFDLVLQFHENDRSGYQWYRKN